MAVGEYVVAEGENKQGFLRRRLIHVDEARDNLEEGNNGLQDFFESEWKNVHEIGRVQIVGLISVLDNGYLAE